MINHFYRVYLSAVLLLYLTTPLHYVINQKCFVFSINVCPAYLAFLSIFWLLWLGYVSASIILFFSQQHSTTTPEVPNNQTDNPAMKCHIWTEINLNSSVDNALLEIFNEILAKHVLSWYLKISSDPGFTNEVRSLLHYLTRAVILRLQNCDITGLIKLKLIPCILEHIHTHRHSVTHNIRTNEFLRHPSLGHPSCLPVYSTHAVEVLLRHVTPPNVVSSGLMTSLLSNAVGNRVISQGVRRVSQPLFLYRLFNQLLDSSVDKLKPQIPSSPSRPLLSSLLPTTAPLSCVLLDEELAIFIRYLQETGELSVLQCLLDLSEVKEILDGPKIHKEAAVDTIRQIYTTHFLSRSRHALPIYETSINSLSVILQDNSEVTDVIAELLESRVVHQLLDELITTRDVYLYPAFLRSGIYRTHALSHRLIEGSSQVAKQSEDKKIGRNVSTRLNKKDRDSPLLVPKLSKASTIDVIVDQDTTGEKEIYRRTISGPSSQDLASKQRADRTRSFGLENVCVNEDQLEFDLAKWDVYIGEVARIKNIKTVNQFVIHVTRRDVTPESEWNIFRRYSEFEVLDSMLRKFFPAAKMSILPRKILFISNDGLEKRRIELDLYLQSLIKCPELQRSEVVCKFLCEFNDDKLFHAENLGDQAGRVLMSLPKSLLTDKYEFLNKPFEHFIESTEPPTHKHTNDVITKVKTSNKDWKDNLAKYNTVFELRNTPPEPSLIDETPLTLRSWFDIFEFLVDSVLSVPQSIKLLVSSLRTFLPHQTERLLERSISDVITYLSNESYVTFAINKARETLYHSAPQGDNRDLLRVEFETQKRILKERIREIIPGVVVNIFSEQQLLSNLELVVGCFENQETNQQLIASLLDQIILELFPELS